MVIYDVATTPGTPTFVAFAPSTYAHDVYVRDGVMYASEINGGDVSLYDVSDPQNISLMGRTQTPFDFCHNAWTDAGSNYVYTTDERGNAPVAAYDISDPQDLQLIDEFRPSRSLGTGVIPHNVHVTADDYLVISYYTDGVVIVDASVPDNLVEIAYYDHWSGGDGGFFGSWGAYPFLPSGLVLSTDIENGLYVVDVNYERAARLRGTVTDFANGAALNDVEITITSSSSTTARSLATGRYKTGIAEAGSFTVTYSKPGYNSLSFPLDFVRGVEIIQDTFLTQKSLATVTGDVTNAEDMGAVAGAEVRIVSEDGTTTDISDGNGDVAFGQVFTGNYQAFAGRWGFRDQAQSATISANGDNISFVLEPGYRDGFAVDQGWTVSGTPGSGDWVRGVPVGTSFGNDASNPGADADGDVGDFAFVTGNGGGSAGFDDVDGGTTTLTSPVFDPADVGFGDIMVTYEYWFYNDGGNGAPDDEMTVSLFNGTDREVLRTYAAVDNTSAWTGDAFNLSDASITITPTMQIEVVIGDLGGGHLVEGGFDNFEMTALGTLPAELTTFTATSTDKQTAALNWTTSTEVNTDYFAVERSADGRMFTTIGRLAAAGNATLATNYTFEDHAPRPGDNYYRLRMTDRDGSFAFSEVRTLNFAEGTLSLRITPNPATDFISLAGISSGKVAIYDTSGRLLLTREVRDGRIRIDELSPGTYWLRSGDKSYPFLKQ